MYSGYVSPEEIEAKQEEMYERAAEAEERYEYLTYEWRNNKIIVHGWDIWPNNSVLAGQERKSFIDSFETEEDAQIAFPTAAASHELMQPQNTFNHLSDEGDY